MPNHQTITALIISTLLALVSTMSAHAADTQQMVRDAIAHHDQGQYEQSIELLQEVVKLEPENGYAAYELALSHQANGELDKCAKVAGRGMRKIQNNEEQSAYMPELAMIQASCYSTAGKTRKAIKTFEAALKEHPDNFWLNFNIAITLAKTDRIDDAIRHLQAAIRIDPRHPSPYYVVGGAYYERGQSVNAFLAYTNFLQREFNTERCTGAAQWLIDTVYLSVGPNEEGDGSAIFLSPPSPGDSPDMMTLNLALALSAMASTSESETETPDADSAAQAIASFLGIAGELELESESDSFFANHMLSGVRDIEKNGVGTAFSHFVVSVAGMPDANDWLESHPEETDALVSFFESLSTQEDPDQ